jgi:hypothetical protein
VADCAVAASPQDVSFFMRSLRAMKVMMRLLQVKVVLVNVVTAHQVKRAIVTSQVDAALG